MEIIANSLLTKLEGIEVWLLALATIQMPHVYMHAYKNG